MPDLTKITLAEAQAAMFLKGLKLGNIRWAYSATIPSGSVISQDPAAGVKVSPGATVDLLASLGPQLVDVPGVVGQTQTSAAAALAGVGLIVGDVTQEYSSSAPSGNVISQIPVAGEQAPPGSAVALVVSKGPQPVPAPNVVGQTQAAAATAIAGAGLVLGAVTEAFSASAPEGSVISQNPVAGELAPPGSAVALVVSKGPQPVSVPNVVEQTLAAATTAITSLGLVVGVVTEDYHASIPLGQIISQAPGAGEQVAPGTAINLVKSKGPAPIEYTTVPDVVGQTQAAATMSIAGVGLTVHSVTKAYSASTPIGRVISQVPAANTQVSPGSLVDLVVSKGPQPVSVPNVVRQTQSAASEAITGAGLVVGAVTEAFSTTVPRGDVITQDPAAGVLLAPGAAVNLTVSKGPQMAVVPSLTGMTQANAEAAITGAGLTVGTVTELYSATAPEGSVLSQDPAGETLLLPGSPVNLVIAANSLSLCDYYPLAVGNSWATSGTTGNNGIHAEIMEAFVINGCQCWKMRAIDHAANDKVTDSYLANANGGMYSYKILDDLFLLPGISPNAQRIGPQSVIPGQSFVTNFNGLSLTVTPVIGRLSDFVDTSKCPFGDVEDTVALKLGNIVLTVFGRNLGPLYYNYLTSSGFYTSITIVGGCGSTQ